MQEGLYKKKMNNKEFIPANIRGEYSIKESDAGFYHYLMTRKLINPADPLNPVIITRVRCFRHADHKKYFECSTEANIRFLKAMNYVSAELIHDPSKEVKKVEPVPGPVTAQKLSDSPEMYASTNVAPVKIPVKRNPRKR